MLQWRCVETISLAGKIYEQQEVETSVHLLLFYFREVALVTPNGAQHLRGNNEVGVGGDGENKGLFCNNE